MSNNDEEDDLFNKCLQHCIDQNKLIYNLNEFSISKNFYNIYPTEILNKFSSSKALFDVKNNIIQISIKLRNCAEYVDHLWCKKKKKCSNFHICPNKLKLTKCNDKNCKMSHSFRALHNLNILKVNNLNANPDIVLRFFQVYYTMFEGTNVTNHACAFFSKENKLDESLMHNTQNNNKKEQLVENTLNETNQIQEKSINKRWILLKNLEKKKKENDVKRFAFYLTKVDAASCHLHDEQTGAWMVYLNSDLDPILIKNNYHKVKSQLPPGLKYEFVYDKNKGLDDQTTCKNNQVNKEEKVIEKSGNNNNQSVKRNISKRMIYLKNVSKNKKVTDVNRFAFYLTNVYVASCNLHHENTGTWIVNFESDIDPVAIVDNYPKVKGCLPPNLKYEFAYLNDFINNENNNEINYELIKPLSQNSFLKIILNGRNQQWQKELFETIEKEENVSLTFDNINMKIISNSNKIMSYKEWKYKIDYCISEYLKKYHLEIINYKKEQYPEIQKMIKKIEDIRKLYLLDYLDDFPSNYLFLMGLKWHIEDFFERNEDLKNLSKLYKMNIKPPTSNDNSAVIKSLNIPKLKNDDFVYNKIGLISMLMPKLVKMKNLIEYTFNIDENIIDLNGPKKNVDETINLLTINLPNIKCKRLLLNLSILNDIFYLNMLSNISINMNIVFKFILEEDESTKKLFYKLWSNITANNKQDDFLQIYLTYFYNFTEINSNLDTVFDTINNVLNKKFSLIELDFTNYLHFLEETKWKQFVEQNLTNKANQNKLFYSIIKSKKSDLAKFLLYGVNDYVDLIKIKIVVLLSSDEFKTYNLNLAEDDMIYLKYVNVDFKKDLETKFEVNINFNENVLTKAFNLVLTNCPNNLVEIIDKEIKKECNKKIVKNISTQYLPGLSYALTKKDAFKQELTKKSREMNSFINVSLNIMAKSEDEMPKDSENKIKSSIEDEPTQEDKLKPKKDFSFMKSRSKKEPDSVDNLLKNKIKIGNSNINLKIGNILRENSDVIVNSTSKDLSLNTGVLSKSIYEKAGVEILNECKLKYPNGIDSTKIAITSAGKIKGVKYLYHVAPPNYMNSYDQSDMFFTRIITNCLTTLKEQNLKSISFPSIGTRGFGHPNNLVAMFSLNSAIKFLEKNSNKEFDVSFVIYEKDDDIIQAYETEFLNYKKVTLSNLAKEHNIENFVDNKEKTQATFKIVCKSLEEFENIEKMIQDLLFKNYIVKDEINNSSIKLLSKDEIKNLAIKFENCEFSFKNDKLLIYGYNEEVLKAKNEVNSYLVDKIVKKNNDIEEKLNLCKNAQWLYEHKNDDWKTFPLYINSLIESGYLKKEPIVAFKNEEDEDAKVYLNLNPKVYCFLGNKHKIRRVEISRFEENFKFPPNWTYLNDDDYNLVDVQNSSLEAINIFNDFKAKFGNNHQILSFRLERVQNKSLFKQYLIHKEKLTKKHNNSSELFLFHGTQEININSIAKFGFNRSLCGTNGVAYGQGVYFAVNSSYSHNYNRNNYSNVRKMFRTRVIIGECCIGNSSMKVPPNKPNGEPYDSTCDQKREIFVCYHDNQCYPEYIITYSL